MNKKNMAMLIAIAMIFSLFTGINFGTGKAQAEAANVSDVKVATDCAINVSGEINGGEDTKDLTYNKYEGTAGPKTEAVSKAAFTISATKSAVASYYYIEETDKSNAKNYEVWDLTHLENVKNWNTYSQPIALSDSYAGKQIVIYAKFEIKDENENKKAAYLHTDIIKIAEKADLATSTKPAATPTVSTAPTEQPTEQPTQQPTENPTATQSQSPTGIPTAEPSQNPTENPTTEPSQNPMVTPTVEPSKTPDKKLSVNYDNSDKYVKSGTALNLKVTVKTDTQCTYKWYKKGSDKSLSEKSSYKTPKNAKIGKYTYYCEISADGYETVKCEFTVIVYKSVITVAWGSSATSKGIFGTSPNVKKITVPSKYKKNLSVNAKNGKISVKKYFSGKAVVTYVIGKNKIKITVKSKIPQIKYTATYSKKKQQLEVKINRFVMSNLSHVYIMAKGNNHWNSRCYKLVKLPIKKKKNSVIIKGYTVKITNFEMKFLLNTNADTYKAWKHNKKSKTNVVKQK